MPRCCCLWVYHLYSLEIPVSLVHAGIRTGSNFPPSTQSHPAQAEASSLSLALSGSRNAARKGEVRPLAHPFSSVLSLLRKNAPIPLSYRPFYLCPSCRRRGVAFPLSFLALWFLPLAMISRSTGATAVPWAFIGAAALEARAQPPSLDAC